MSAESGSDRLAGKKSDTDTGRRRCEAQSMKADGGGRSKTTG